MASLRACIGETNIVDIRMLGSLFESGMKEMLRDGLSKLFSFSSHCSSVALKVGVTKPLEELGDTKDATKLVVHTLDETKAILGIEAVVAHVRDHDGDEKHAKGVKATLDAAGVVLPPPIFELLDKAVKGAKRSLERELSAATDPAGTRRKRAAAAQRP